MIGINTAVAGVGLGLAVPINAATRQIVGALMRDGRVRRAYIGIAGGPRPLPPHARARLGRKAGVEVVEVAAGSPASARGLRAEDLIVELGGRADRARRRRAAADEPATRSGVRCRSGCCAATAGWTSRSRRSSWLE